MPKVSRTTAEIRDHGPVVDRFAELAGYRAQFVTFNVDTDATPFLKGLPHDLCSAAHWGYVFKGKVTYRYADGTEEVHEAGDAFYAPAPHTSIAAAGTEYLQFSPAAEMAVVEAQIMKNMQAVSGS